jgi:hypothetical protein
LALSGCGGDSGTQPTAVTTPTRPTPVTTVLVQNSFTGLDPQGVLVITFQVTNAGDLDAVVDWTFASNNLDVALARGQRTCVTTGNVVDLSQCTVAATAASLTSKPERLHIGPLAADTYTLYIGNFGSTTESLSYQISLTYTPSAGSPGGSVSALPGGTGEPMILQARAWR